MTYKNEYLVKIGYTDSIFGLINLYIIKNEISKTIYLEEGKPKIFTFPKDEDNITIQINLVDDDISYINLRIPLKSKISEKIRSLLFALYPAFKRSNILARKTLRSLMPVKRHQFFVMKYIKFP